MMTSFYITRNDVIHRRGTSCAGVTRSISVEEILSLENPYFCKVCKAGNAWEKLYRRG